MPHSKVQDGVEIERGRGCELETWSAQSASPDCLRECKKRMPPCTAYSYNSYTTKCTTVAGCDLLLFSNISTSITYYSSMIPRLAFFLKPLITLAFVPVLMPQSRFEQKQMHWNIILEIIGLKELQLSCMPIFFALSSFSNKAIIMACTFIRWYLVIVLTFDISSDTIKTYFLSFISCKRPLLAKLHFYFQL